VLTYHRFGDSPRDPFCVRRKDFEAQMRWLADERLALSLEDVEELLAGEEDMHGRVLVTIDDGCRSTLTSALPVLREYGIPAVAYVVVGSMGKGRGVDGDQPEDYMTWDEVDSLLETGIVTIGSHAVHHRSLGRMDPAEALDEAILSKEILDRRLGTETRSFAYPFGTRADYGKDTRRALAEAGYTTGFTSQHGCITEGLDPLELPRIKVEGGEPLWMFQKLCRGAMDAWRHVDRTLWSLQTRARHARAG
jgi:peptidoglycan/xylan/chitin deacetylase (PgdA/CDA1 family)